LSRDDSTQPIGRPFILPEVFNREEDFGKCSSSQQVGRHCQIAVVAHVLAGKVHVVLSRTKSESYKQAREVLQRRFEPSSKSELYKNGLQHVAK